MTATAELILPEFRKPDEIISEIREKYTGMTVAKDGYKTVRAARLELKKLRCDVENLRKDLKEESLKRGRAIDSEANRLKAMLEPIEQALAAEEKAEDDRKAEELRAIQEAAERKLQSRVDAVVEAGGTPVVSIIRPMSDDEFAGYLEAVRVEVAELAEAKRAEEDARAKREAEERAERERLEAERAEELARQAEELRIREAELAEARKVEAEQLQAMREQIEHERAEFRKQQEIAAGRERLAEAERRRVEAEKRAEDDRIEAERLEAERLERLEALKPEIEKVVKFRSQMLKHAKAELKKLGNPSWGDDVLESICSAVDSVEASLSSV
jgi:chemosensory pili system protein ChpA (sensor histidine kinase/response regulator)